MTPDEYKTWKPRFDAAMADHTKRWPELSSESIAADRLVRETTLATFAEKINASDMPDVLKSWVIQTAGWHFGSVETDEMLTALGCYPDWM